MPRHRQIWLAVALLFVISAAGAFAFWGTVSAEAKEQRVFPGVSVHGVPLGGLDPDGCLERLAALDQHLRDTNITLRLNDQTWPVQLGQLGVSLDSPAIVSQAYQVGRDGFVINQWIERRRVEQYGSKIPLQISLSEEQLQRTVSELVGDVVKPPKDAGFTITEQDTVEMVSEEPGYVVDYHSLKEALLTRVNQFGHVTINVELDKVAPNHTLAEVEALQLNGLVSRFTTRFDPSLVDRSYNVAVSAKALSNLLITPGEVVSFNEIVGPRSQEAGYRSALIIIENEFQEGLGGGVCQVSTTLYNTVLLANLEIVERKNHSLPVAYVPIGRDATVVYEVIDFKFRNNTNSFLYLKTELGNGTLTMKLFGDARDMPKVEVRSWVTETLEPRVVYEDDALLEIGEEIIKQKGVKGYRARAERWVWRDGAVEKTELPPSFYHPQNEVVAVGTKEAPPTVVAPSPDTPVIIPSEPIDDPSLPDGILPF